MTSALVTVDREIAGPIVSAEQLRLVKQTIARDATDAELNLFLYDCQRQGVHPLDRLLHFTKRGGKYTPVTSIDLMRTRAADTGDYAGSDDAVFPGFIEDDRGNFYATVTVWRIVQGQRCAFTATARWSEYYPGDAAGAMWRKMPHTMLAKCAEALALRKGFPRQLAGLYAKEELDQAQAGESRGYSVTPPAEPVPLAEQPSNPHSYATTANTGPRPEMPDGVLRIERVDTSPTKNPNVTKGLITFSSGEVMTTIKPQLIALCEQIAQENLLVTVESKKTKWGTDLIAVHRVPVGEPVVERVDPLDGGSIPF